jgi:hypothetical protein
VWETKSVHLAVFVVGLYRMATKEFNGYNGFNLSMHQIQNFTAINHA